MLLSKSELDVVVFKILPDLPYSRRMLISFGLLLLGFAIQAYLLSWLPGVFFVAAGTLLLVTSGYDNRVDSDGFSVSSEWQSVERTKLLEVKSLHKRMEEWDRSLLDISNPLGAFALLVIAGIGAVLIISEDDLGILLGINLLVLTVPHWFTGMRSILTKPNLMLKIEALLKLEEECSRDIQPDRISYSMLLNPKAETSIPRDVKFQIRPAESHEDFLGLQGQASINSVQGKSYIYFYVVLVARAGYGLTQMTADWFPPKGIIKEYSTKDRSVEVVVIRQKTTKKSGYYTSPQRCRELLLCSHELLKQVLQK